MSINPVENLPLEEESKLFKGMCDTRIKFVDVDYIWMISNFSLRPEDLGQYITSPTFPHEPETKVKWGMKLYPAGLDKENKDYVSVFLYPVSCNNAGVKAKFTLKVLNLNREDIVVHEGTHLFKKGSDWGFRRFILQKNVPNDKFILSCQIRAGIETVNISNQPCITTAPQGNLSDDYRILFENQDFSDVVLVAGERKFKTHKVILGARSSVFKAMFLNQMKESELNQVEILDVDHTVLNEMLRFIYTGEVQNLKSIASDLLFVADKYALESLKVMCEEELCKNLSVENAAELLILSDLHNSIQLKFQTKKFINTYAQEITETPGWKSMIQSYPYLITEVVRDLATNRILVTISKDKL